MQLKAMSEAVDYDLLAELMAHRPDIPVGECDGVKVTRRIAPAGEKFTVVSMRNALFMGMKPSSVSFADETPIHELSYERGVWMSSVPQEVYQMRHAVQHLWGNVLVGGLGLGIISKLITDLNVEADEVLTVEKDERIIKLVADHIVNDFNHVIHADLYDHIRETSNQYDSAFLDIWQPTGEMCWVEHIVPLRRLCRGKIEQEDIICWNEDEMTSQLSYKSFIVGLDCIPSIMINQKVLSAYAIRSELIDHQMLMKELRQKDSMNKLILEEHALLEDSNIVGAMELFMRPGTDSWEREFGELWDHYDQEYRSSKD